MKSRGKSRSSEIQMPIWAVIALIAIAAQPVSAGQGAPESATLALSVLDKLTGKPVPNAEIRVSLSGEGISSEQRKQELGTSAGGLCTVVFPVRSPEMTKFWIKAPGYVPVFACWDNSEGKKEPDPIPESFVFPLEKGTSIGGIVRNGQDKPVEGVKVYFMLANQRGRIRYSIRDSFSTTDAEGKWRSDILPENIDQLWLNLKHPDYVTSEIWNTIPVPPEKDLRDLTSVMVLKSGVMLSGVVRDDKGNPIHKALVQLGSSGYSNKTVRTDKQGQFTFENCDEGSLHVSVQARGRSPQARRFSPEEIAAPLEFTLEPGNSIRIRVVDSNGTVLSGVYVVPETYQGYRYILKIDPNKPRQTGVQTDDKGLVAWESAPPDAVQYAFSKEGYARLSEVELVADGKEHTVTLPRPIHVVGTVVDKETGEPVPAFHVVPTLDWLTGSPPFISRRGAFQAEAGRFEWKTGRTDTGHYVRIEAKGYLPAMSKMLRVGACEQATLNFELERGLDIEGTVQGVDGEPLADADVLMCTAMQSVNLSNGKLSRRDGTLIAKTTAQGRFSFPPEPDPFLLVVAHDAGYAQVTQDEIANSGQICLQAWARIEGKLLQGGEPAVGHRIRISPVRVGNSTAPHFFAQYYSTTNEEGEFVFERVAPGPVSLSPDLGPWEQSKLTSAQHVPLVAKPGQTARLSLGTEGKTVTGKIMLPPTIQRDMSWECGINYLVALKDGIPVPDEIKDLDFDWRRGYSDAWSSSRAGRVYFQTLHKHFVKLKTDGSFRINGVEPGKYQLALRIYDPPRGMG